MLYRVVNRIDCMKYFEIVEFFNFTFDPDKVAVKRQQIFTTSFVCHHTQGPAKGGHWEVIDD